VLASLQMLTGGVEAVLSTWVLLGLLALGDLLAGRGCRGRLTARFLSVVLLVSLMSAVQLLPFLELLAGSERSEMSAGDLSAMPAYGWANFLVPLFGTSRTANGLPFQPSQYWLTSYYLGTGSVALALTALLLRPSRRVWLLGGAGALSLVLALGNHGLVYAWCARACPPVGLMRFLVKFVLPLTLLTPLLVAEAARRLSTMSGDTARRFRPRLLLVFGFLALAITGLAVLAPSVQTVPALVRETRINALVRLVFLVAMGGLALGLPAARARGRLPWVGGALLLVWWLDVFTHAPKQAPTVASETVRMPLASFRSMSEPPRAGLNRALLSPRALAIFDRTQLAGWAESYLGLRLGLDLNCNLLEGIPKADGFYSLFPRYHARLLFRFYQSPAAPEPLCDFLGVSQITAPGNVTDWQARPSWMPLATGGQAPVWCDDRAALDRLFSAEFDPRRELLLPAEARAELPPVSPGKPVVRLMSFSNHALRVAVDSDRSTLVSLAQSYYPAWRATLDGAPVRIWRSNLAFQALAVPTGRHQVVLAYEDAGLHLGAGISCLTTVGLLTCWIRRPRGPGFAANGRSPSARRA
jgi:hypothetical protein